MYKLQQLSRLDRQGSLALDLRCLHICQPDGTKEGALIWEDKSHREVRAYKQN